MFVFRAVCREFGIQIGRIWLIFQLFSPGMFIASTALLPSSFSMYFASASFAAWWHQKYRLAIFFTAISALLGWPFAALLGLPLVFDMLFRLGKYKTFLKWTIISAVTILMPMLSIDTTYFGKFTAAPLNIIIYNVFTSHGPDLYGTEPWTYYFLNGFLNFNIIWIFALITPIMLLIGYQFVPAKSKATLYLPHYISLAPFYLWLLVFVAQSHKEERFLFPIYLLINLCAAVSIDVVQKLYFRIKSWWFLLPPGTHYLDHATWISVVIAIISAALGIFRILALFNNYHAPLDLMMELNTFSRLPENQLRSTDLVYNVCVGKDWYRFPSSFFLPSKQFRIRFLRSEFKGILPAYYTETKNGSHVVHNYFNDQNQENAAMYTDIGQCHFLLDLDLGEYTDLEPNYVQATETWTIVKGLPFLNAKRSHSLFRAFYIPFVNDWYVNYSEFYLLQRKKVKTKNSVLN